MMAILQASFFWFFAIVGFCEIARRILSIFMNQVNSQETNVLLTVKNEEETIEDKVRSLVFSYSQRHDEKMPRIIIVDLDSTDDTYGILEKLAEEYSFIYPMKKDSYIEYCNHMVEG